MDLQTIKSFLRGVIYAGIFTVPFLPFMVSTALFFPFISTKGFVFRIVVGIILFAWLALCVVDKTVRPRFSWILGSFAVFLTIIALADLQGLNPAKSFWSNYERMEGWFLLLHLFGYILVLGSFLREKIWNYFWHTTLGASALVSCVGIFQLLGWVKINQGNVRVDAYIGNATYLAVYLLIHIFLALFLFVRRQERDFISWTYVGIALLNIVILYYSATRGAILGLFVGMFVTSVGWFLFAKEYPKTRLYARNMLIVLGVIILGFLAIKNTQFAQNHPVLSRFTSLTFSEATVGSRFMVWDMAWEGFKEKPLLGWGQENFNYVFNKYYNPNMFNQEPWFDRTHSVVFDWMISGGALGFLSYVSILLTLVISIWKSTYFSSTEKMVFFGLISAYVFQNLFVFDNLLSYVLFASLLAYVHSSKFFNSPEEKVVFETQAPQFFQYKVVLILCAGLVFLYVVNAKPLFANRSLIRGFVEVQTGVQTQNSAFFENGFSSFEKALAYNSFGTIEIREQIAQVALSLGGVQAMPAETKQKFILLGKKALEDQIKETPQDIRHYALLGSFLNSFSQFNDALTVLAKARELSPKKQFILFEMATAHLNKGEYEKAYELFKEGYELSPQFSQIRLMYALGALYAGKDDIAQEMLKTVPRNEYIFDNRFIALYEMRKDYKTIVSVLEERVSLGTTNPNDFLSLAAVYLEVGRRADAIEQIKKAVELDSSLKPQADFYIEEIRAGRNP